MNPCMPLNFGLEQLRRDSQAPEVRMDRDIENLPLLIGHPARNDKSGDPAVEKGDATIESQVVLRLPLRRFGRGSLDDRDLIEITRSGAPQLNARRQQFPDQRALARSNFLPAEIGFHVSAAGCGKLLAQ